MGQMTRDLDVHQGRIAPLRLSSAHSIMKTTSSLLLGVAVVAGLVLSGCSKGEKAVETTAQAPAPGPAATSPAAARAIAITANDTMKFNLIEIRAKPGEALAVTLTNEGTAPKMAMGHNWVLLAEGTDLGALATAAVTAAATEYIPAAFKDSVLVATKLLGPKESDTATFHAPAKPGRYPFVCTFPGHMQVGMKGELIVE